MRTPLPAVLSHRRRAAACADFAATPFHVSLAFIARRDGGAESGRVPSISKTSRTKREYFAAAPWRRGRVCLSHQRRQPKRRRPIRQGRACHRKAPTKAIVFVAEKDAFAPIATLRDVMRQTGDDVAGDAVHGLGAPGLRQNRSNREIVESRKGAVA